MCDKLNIDFWTQFQFRDTKKMNTAAGQFVYFWFISFAALQYVSVPVSLSTFMHNLQRPFEFFIQTAWNCVESMEFVFPA